MKKASELNVLNIDKILKEIKEQAIHHLECIIVYQAEKLGRSDLFCDLSHLIINKTELGHSLNSVEIKDVIHYIVFTLEHSGYKVTVDSSDQAHISWKTHE